MSTESASPENVKKTIRYLNISVIVTAVLGTILYASGLAERFFGSDSSTVLGILGLFLASDVIAGVVLRKRLAKMEEQ